MHLAHPHVPQSVHLPSRRATWLAAALALVVAGGVALVIALAGSSTDEVTAPAVPVVQAEPPARPDESRVAAAVATASGPAATRPDESQVAAAVGATRAPAPARPDESRVASAISGP
jgi:hypothetical protein